MILALLSARTIGIVNDLVRESDPIESKSLCVAPILFLGVNLSVAVGVSVATATFVAFAYCSL